jgi:outer membrane cobalamin receptor
MPAFASVMLLTAHHALGTLQAEDATPSATPPAGTVPAVPTPVPPGPRTPDAANDATIVVTGRNDSEIGVADSAAQGTTGQADLENRPLLRVGEIMETIPGMIATEHSGGGKANQYFLRGFDLDHGTDFSTSVDGAPVNFRSHAHGQGYTDLNFIIPEVISTIDYRKGPYSAQDGDFGAAGSADIHYADALPHGIASATVGVFNYERGMIADSIALAHGNLLYALDAEHNDGPWDHPNNYKRINGLLRYSSGDSRNGWSLTGSAH